MYLFFDDEYVWICDDLVFPIVHIRHKDHDKDKGEGENKRVREIQ